MTGEKDAVDRQRAASGELQLNLGLESSNHSCCILVRVGARGEVQAEPTTHPTLAFIS